MTVFLVILKVIGWIFLILLLIILFLILLLLFVPITYRAVVSSEEEFWAKVRTSWLFRLVNLHVDYENGQVLVYLRIFGFYKTLMQEEAELAEEELEEEFTHAVEDIPFIEGLEKALGEENIKNAEEDLHEIEDVISVEKPDKQAKKTSSQKKISSAKRKMFSMKSGIFSRIQGIVERIRGMIENISAIFHKVWDLLTDKNNQAAAAHLKKEFFRLLKIIKPSKLGLSAQFSTGAPDRTGLALGILALFPFVYRNKWNVIPDFTTEKPYFKGEADMVGSIFLFRLIGILLRIIKDKNCRRLYSKIREAADNI